MRRRYRESRFSLFAFQDIITSVTGIMILITLVLAIELIERTDSSPKRKTTENIQQLQSQIDENEQEIRRLETLQSASRTATSRLAALDAATLRRRLAERREQANILSQQLTKAERTRIAAVRRMKIIDSQDKQRRATEEQQRDELRRKISETNRNIEKFVTGKRIVFNPAKGLAKTAWIAQISAGKILVAPMGRAGRPESFADEAAFRSWIAAHNASADYVLLVVKPDGIRHFGGVKAQLRSRGFSVGYDLIAADQNAVDPNSGAATP